MSFPASFARALARLAGLVAVISGASLPLRAQCPPGEVPIRADYAGMTVAGVEDQLRQDGDGLYVGVFDNGQIRAPKNDEWGRKIASNAAGCEAGTCQPPSEWVGVVLTPIVVMEVGERPIARDEKGLDAVEPETPWLGYALAGLVGLIVGFVLGRAGRS